MNREARRAARRHCRRHASALADQLLSKPLLSLGGRAQDLAAVEHPAALAAVRRGIIEALRTNVPFVTALAEATARSFPHMRNAGDLGVQGWLAVGIDRDGRAAFLTRRCDAPERDVRAVLIGELIALCQTPGIPMPPARGRA